jgi:hypothetical protein
MKKHRLLTSIFCLSGALLVADQGEMARPEGVTTMPHTVITPAVAPRVENGTGAFVTADFIWWKMHIGQMEYALNGIVDAGNLVPADTSTRKGHVKSPDFDFKPGFKVGAGLKFEHDGWDLYANYTWLKNGESRNHLNGESGKGASSFTNFVAPGPFLSPGALLDALFSPGAVVGTFNIVNARSLFKQHFNAADLELGRNFFISKYLTLRPHVGLKGAYISDELILHFTPTGGAKGFVGEARVLGITKGKQRKHQKMWGVGTRAGLNAVWHFCKNFGLYGDAAVTAFWSDFHVTSKDVVTARPALLPALGDDDDSDDDSDLTTLNTKEVFQEVTPVVEAGIGLTYMTWFYDETCAFDVRAGWEEQVWIDFNRFMDVGTTGNLSLHGLTIKAGLNF